MQTNKRIRLGQNEHIFFEETSIYAIELKNVKSKKNIAIVNRTFASDDKESIDKILEKWIKAIDLND